MARKYDQKRRAAQQGETRQRIVDAAVALHQEKGLAATTMTDIAERADVGRMTLYRHFADEADLVRACSGHYFSTRPFPDTTLWQAIPDPRDRLQAGLRTSYAYHRLTAGMMLANLAAMRDHPSIEPYRAFWRQAGEILAAPFTDRGWPAAELRAALALALDFETWRLLAMDRGMRDEAAADLLVRLVCDCPPGARP